MMNLHKLMTTSGGTLLSCYFHSIVDFMILDATPGKFVKDEKMMYPII